MNIGELIEALAYKMYHRTSIGNPYRPKLNLFCYKVWKSISLWRSR